MKVTEPGLNTLIDNLNTLICEDCLLTRQERETLVRAVAAIGAMKARVSMKQGEASTVARREKREKILQKISHFFCIKCMIFNIKRIKRTNAVVAKLRCPSLSKRRTGRALSKSWSLKCVTHFSWQIARFIFIRTFADTFPAPR
ncbi:TPA: hypothetical protein ACJIXO_003916 [Klebsiella pneumoniae]